MVAPSIEEVSPGNEATGVVLSAPITVLFDREIDPTTVSLFVEGPDHDRWSGPDLTYWDDPNTTSDDDILASPGYHGIVAGELSYIQVNSEGNDISGSHDYSGAGTVWRTKILFTPDLPLSPGVEYRVYIVGDEESNDDILSGVSTRTVFDTVKGSNLGDGEVEFTGGYTGTVEEKIFVELLGTGAAGEVQFSWYKQSLPLQTRELTTKQTSQLLVDGVSVRFISGTFEVGDIYSVVVKPAERMEDTYTWTFTTGSGSIQSIPDDANTSTGVIISGSSISDPLNIVEMTPVEGATHLDPNSVQEIVVKFSKALDETTISDETVLVWTEPVNGDFDGNTIQYSGQLAKVLSVDGDTLTIQIS